MIAALEAKRGLDRDDYPVIPMWNVMVTGVVFQQESIELLQRELSRNPVMLQACGFNVLPRQQKKPVAQLVKNTLTGRMEVVWPQPEALHYAVPNSWKCCRIFADTWVMTVKRSIATALAKSIAKRDTAQTLMLIGHHETAGVTSKTGTPWKQVKSWFGYGLYLITELSRVPSTRIELTPLSIPKKLRFTVFAQVRVASQRDLAFQGFEADRNTLKYRCPAAAYGLDCQVQCHAAWQVNPGDYGRIIRIEITGQNRRIFVSTPYGSPSWKRGYARRSALERINNSFGFEKHSIRGQAKMKTRMGLALAVRWPWRWAM